MKTDFPEIEAINAMYTHGYGTIISARMRFGGFAKTLGMRLLTTAHGIVYPKFIIVVDEDIDPFNLQEVMWAISVRFRPERDLVVIPNAPGSPLDPTSSVRGITTKLIIDATKPVFPDISLSGGVQVDVPPETTFWLDQIAKRRRNR